MCDALCLIGRKRHVNVAPCCFWCFNVFQSVEKCCFYLVKTSEISFTYFLTSCRRLRESFVPVLHLKCRSQVLVIWVFLLYHKISRCTSATESGLGRVSASYKEFFHATGKSWVSVTLPCMESVMRKCRWFICEFIPEAGKNQVRTGFSTSLPDLILNPNQPLLQLIELNKLK